jgi:hypothetical protein
MLAFARQLKAQGIPYVLGGKTMNGPDANGLYAFPHGGLDCSGFVHHVFMHVGIDPGWSTSDEDTDLKNGPVIDRPVPGALVFFTNQQSAGREPRRDRHREPLDDDLRDGVQRHGAGRGPAARGRDNERPRRQLEGVRPGGAPERRGGGHVARQRAGREPGDRRVAARSRWPAC